MNDEVNIEEFDIISDTKPIPDVFGSLTTIAVFIVEAAVFIGFMQMKTSLMMAYLIWIVGAMVGFSIGGMSSYMKYREAAGNIFIDSQTHFADDDVYEMMIVENVETVVEPLEPFPFAKSCYEEDELAETLTRINAEYLKDEIIKEKLKREKDEILAQMEEGDSKKRRLLKWLRR